MKKLLMSALMTSAVSMSTLSAQAAPLFNIFELGVQPGQTAAYDEVGRHNITTSVGKEAGTLGMYSVKQKDNPDMAYMFEIYADDTAYRTHIQSPQYKAFLQKSPQLLTDHKRRIEVVPQFLGDKKFQQTPQTINNLVIVDVKPASAQAFRNVVMPEMAKSIEVEDGVHAIYAATEKSHPTRWYFYEIYASDAAYQSHRQTPHFQDYLKRTADMLQDKEAIAVVPSLLMNKGGLRYEAKE